MPLVVRLADDVPRLDPRARQADRPGGAPVVAAVQVVDLRGAAELGHHHDEGVLQQSPRGQVLDQRRERVVELADLFEVEVEVLVVGVVIRVDDLDERGARLQQPTGQQAVAAEVVRAVAVQVLRRLLGDVEDVAPGHQLLGLLVGRRVRLGLGGPPAAGEAVADAPRRARRPAAPGP